MLLFMTGKPSDLEAASLQILPYSKYVAEAMLGATQAILDEMQKDTKEDANWQEQLNMRNMRVTVDEAKESIEANQKRLDHAIKCIQRKGLYATSIDGMDDMFERNGCIREAVFLRMLHACVGILALPGPDFITEQSWEKGVELAMFWTQDKKFMSRDLYGPYLKENIGLIAAFSLFCALTEHVQNQLNMHMERIDKLDHAAKAMGGFENAFQVFASTTDKMFNENKRIKDEMMHQIMRTRENAEAEKESLRKKVEEAQKALRPLEAENRKLSTQIIDLQSERSEKAAKIKELENENAGLKQRIAELEAQVAGLMGADLPDLPERGILFVGGHINLTKKIAQKHPEWRFIASQDTTVPEMSSCVCAFFWDKHMSHKIWQNVKAHLPLGTPTAYLKSVNIELLEREMRTAWATMCHDESEEEQ